MPVQYSEWNLKQKKRFLYFYKYYINDENEVMANFKPGD